MITLYTIGCPLCKMLEVMLEQKGIDYNKVTDEDEIVARGIKSMPTLEVNEQRMDFGTARKWIIAQEAVK